MHFNALKITKDSINWQVSNTLTKDYAMKMTLIMGMLVLSVGVQQAQAEVVETEIGKPRVQNVIEITGEEIDVDSNVKPMPRIVINPKPDSTSNRNTGRGRVNEPAKATSDKPTSPTVKPSTPASAPAKVVAPYAAPTSISRKMTLAVVSKEYECPLFSNSPYNDLLVSLDNMQKNLNNIYSSCGANSVNQQLSQKSVELRKSIIQTKALSESGQAYQMSESVEDVVSISQEIQNLLISASDAENKVCFKPNQEFRSVVFSINETFQGIAPLILDIASKNPALAASMEGSLKVLAGVEHLSKGLGLIEKIANESVMFDMSIAENRTNTIKNVCQYMKLYRRMDYLRKSRFGKTQEIFSEYHSLLSNLAK